MPRNRSLKSLVAETVLFFGLCSLIGNLSISFWERHTIQTELSNMKTSLHSLKKTINNIGTAYDNLHKELKVIAFVTAKRPNEPLHEKDQDADHYKNKYTLDRREFRDLKLQTMMLRKSDANLGTNPIILFNKTTQNLTHNQNNVTDIGRDATTITKYPPKSKRVGLNNTSVMFNSNRRECLDERHDHNIRKCYRDYECCNFTCSQWKF